MHRNEIAEFHYITPITNLRSIFEHGIVSHIGAKSLVHESVASEVIQDRRRKPVPGGRRLHDYVNLYFHARNPMLFLRRGLHETLCVLKVSPDVLEMPGTIVTNANAAGDWVRFAPAPDGLSIVDEQLTFAEWWTDVDPIVQMRKKAARCAEVLVPDRVAPSLIVHALVSSATSRDRCIELGIPCGVTIDRHMFFQ